jgi:hypothetical protein
MAKQLRHFTSFNAGELSPKLDARVDLAKYQNGCRELKNCIAGLYGEAERRTGFQYIASTKDSTTKARLFEWEFSTTTTYILEFGHLYVRFYSSRAQVLSGGSAYEVASPYTEDQIFELQLAQLNDVGRITHPDHPPAKLTRVSAVVWTLAYIQFLNPPVLDENTSTITITPSATSGAITLTASAPLFDAGQEAGYFRIGYLREASFEESIINADLTATGLPIIGDWNLRTYGVWSADILIQRSLDGGTTWDTIRKFSGKFDRNVDSVGEQSFEAKLRVKIENYAAPAVAGATTPRVVLEAVDAYIWGTVQIDGFTSSTVLTTPPLPRQSGPRGLGRSCAGGLVPSRSTSNESCMAGPTTGGRPSGDPQSMTTTTSSTALETPTPLPSLWPPSASRPSCGSLPRRH